MSSCKGQNLCLVLPLHKKNSNVLQYSSSVCPLMSLPSELKELIGSYLSVRDVYNYAVAIQYPIINLYQTKLMQLYGTVDTQMLIFYLLLFHPYNDINLLRCGAKLYPDLLHVDKIKFLFQYIMMLESCIVHPNDIYHQNSKYHVVMKFCHCNNDNHINVCICLFRDKQQVFCNIVPTPKTMMDMIVSAKNTITGNQFDNIRNYQPLRVSDDFVVVTNVNNGDGDGDSNSNHDYNSRLEYTSNSCHYYVNYELVYAIHMQHYCIINNIFDIGHLNDIQLKNFRCAFTK